MSPHLRDRTSQYVGAEQARLVGTPEVLVDVVEGGDLEDCSLHYTTGINIIQLFQVKYMV